MRQVLFDVPSNVFGHQFPSDAFAKPIKVNGRNGSARVLAMCLRQRAIDFITRPSYDRAPELRDEACAVLQTVVCDHLAGQSGTGLSVSYLAAARSYVAQNVHDPDLNATRLAAALGISLRHLTRLFAAQGQTPAYYIRTLRLQKALADLADPSQAHLSVADIAFKWGFVSQAHFSRVFRQEFGLSPKQSRDESRHGSAPASVPAKMASGLADGDHRSSLCQDSQTACEQPDANAKDKQCLGQADVVGQPPHAQNRQDAAQIGDYQVG